MDASSYTLSAQGIKHIACHDKGHTKVLCANPVTATVDWVVRVHRILLAPPQIIADLLVTYLQRTTVSWGTKYASWHIPHDKACSAHRVDFGSNFNAVRTVYQ